MISISCLESKLLNNNNWYGRFQLAPFQKGEGLTVANALRRTLLAEKSNFFITWVDFYNAEIPYSVLTGMRESIFDILLNLKQVIFTSDKIRPNTSHFLKNSAACEMMGVNNFKTQKVKFLSRGATDRLTYQPLVRKKLKAESTINFLDSKKDNFQIIPNGINNQTIEINQRVAQRDLKNLKTNVKNIFCKNQILGKMINSNHEVSSLVQLGIFNKSINVGDQFLNGSSYTSPSKKNLSFEKIEWKQNEKKISNSNFIGYICAKGPTIIYAKNIKLPKGVKCVDPDKYIVTLADDGLFYLRFALTTEIQTLPPIDKSNRSININQGIKFNKVRLKTFPKILFHKEIPSCSSFKIISSSKNKKKKSNQPCFNNSQVHFWRSYPIASHILPFLKQKDPSFDQSMVRSEKKISFLSQIKLYNSKTQPVNHIKNLIQEQRLLITNDSSIKQLNFQNTSMIANIQKTCLLNLQIKHYYYKCGRFDRFLFDLIKPFKPTLKSTYYNEFYLQKKGMAQRENLFYQSSNIKVLTRCATPGFYKTFQCQQYSSQLFINYNLFHDHLASGPKKGETSLLMKDGVKTHTYLKSLQGHKYKRFAERRILSLATVGNTAGETVGGNQLLSSFSSKNNTFGFFYGLPLEHHNINSPKGYSLKNKYLLKWQKIFKSIKTSSIYDYLKKLSTSQARLTCLLPIKPLIEIRISLNKKLISTSVPENVLNTNTFVFSNLPENTKEFFFFVGTSLSILKLHKPYLKKFLTFGISFQCSQNNILWFLKSYILQHNNSLNYPAARDRGLHTPGGKNSVDIKNRSRFPKRELTRCATPNILFLKEQSQTSTHFPIDSKLWDGTSLLEVLFWMNENQKPKNDYHLREFYYEKKHGSMIKKTDFFSSVNNLHKLTGSMAISGYMLSYNLFYKKPSPLRDHFINQSCIDLNLFNSFNPVGLSTTLRTKPLTSIRQVFYKPLWILPCDFQNPDLLRSWLNHINLPNSIHEKRTKNQFLNISCLAKNRGREAGLKKTFNSIPINSVILKPIYLHVEQIIYILKQTTKFRKNQLINPVFFNRFKKPAVRDRGLHTPGGNNRISLTDYYPKFSKISNNLHNSFLYEPCNLKTNKAPLHLLKSCKQLCAKPWGESGTKPKIRLSFLDLYSLKNLNNKLNLDWYIKNTKWYQKQMPLARPWLAHPWGEKNSIHKLALSNIWIFHSNFVFKNNLSYRYLKNQATLHFREGCKIFQTKQWIRTPSNLLYVSRFFNVPLKFVSFFLKPSMSFLHALNKVIPGNLTTINDFSQMDVTYNHPFFFMNKKTNADFIYDNKPKIKMNDLYNEPYNINIYNSKISFNLRYTYPFKYTIFETFLPFQFMTDFSNKISKHRHDTIMFMAKEQKNKHFQATEKDKKEISVFNQTMVSYPEIDFIQYNESFKIYTTLAYTCLKTSDPPLAKYYNFNKPPKKKSQDISFKVTPFQSSYFRSYGDSVFSKNLFPQGCASHGLAQGQNIVLKPSILDWKFLNQKQPRCARPWEIIDFGHAPTHLSHQNGGKILCAKPWGEKWLLACNPLANPRGKHLFKVAQQDKISRCATPYFKSAFAESFSIKQILIEKIISKIFTIYHNNSFGLNNNSLPSIFDNTDKWRIINNPNFNDAFIIIPSTWSLNFQSNGLSLDVSPNIINKFYSFLPPMQNFFMNYVSKNLIKILFLNFFCKSKEIIKNKLYWSRKSITTNKNIVLTWIRPYREKSTKFRIVRENYDQSTNNPFTTDFLVGQPLVACQPPGKKSSRIPKSKLHRSLKRLAINFETSYYKNFLWNSRKITLRVLNNAVLPLVANRKYSISNFVLNKNHNINAFFNATMSQSVNFSPDFESVAKRAPFIYNNKQKPRSYFDSNKNKSINKITKNWLHQTSFTNRLFEIYNYQKSQRFYSIRHKTLETTNFMCEKTYPISINENQRQTILKPNFLINHEFDGFSQSSFSFLGSKLKPFFYGSLKHFQAKSVDGSSTLLPISVSNRNRDAASPDVSHLTQPLGGSKEKNQFSRLPFVHFATRRRKQSENNEQYLLSYNQITPEKLAYFRRRNWIEKLTQGSKVSNEANTSIANLKVKLPLNSNLWWSSFFCRYSLYAISTQSDLFLQNLINFSGVKNQTKDAFVLSQAKSVDDPSTLLPISVSNKNRDAASSHLPHLTEPWGENIDGNDNGILTNHQMKKMPFQYKQNDTYQFLNIKPSIKSYEETMKKILKLQDSSLEVANELNYFVPGYDYNWQKAIHFTILHGLKKTKFHDKKKNIDSINQNSIKALKNYYSVRRLKNNSYYFGNPLRRRTNEKSLTIYNIKSPTKLYQKFTTQSSFLPHHLAKRVNKQAVVKSWKSIIWKAEANRYFCFKYPIFIQNCNLPWQKSKHIFGISKHWFNKITIDLTPRCAIPWLAHPWGFKWISFNDGEAGFLSKITNLNKGINPKLIANGFFMIYTQLASSSNKTHQSLLHTQQFNNLISSVHIDIQNQGSYETVSYFSIKEGLNSIYKVNYIVESHVSESKPIYELKSHSNQNNKFLGFGTNSTRGWQATISHTIKKFETIQRDSNTTDSLTVSNFLNSPYSFAPNKTIMLSSFNGLINSSINKSQINHQNEYIQIDIWTNGEISPRQALLNAFKKLFELFYNLSKYNCLKPIEI